LRASAAFERGDHASARTLVEKSLEHIPESDTEMRTWAGYVRAALLPVFEQDPVALRKEFEEARRQMHAGGDRWGEGWALSSLGMRATSSGDIALAERHYMEGLALAVEIGSESMLGQFQTQLGFAYLAGGRHDEAHDRLASAVDIYRRFHFREGLAYVLEALAMLGLAQGSPEQAMVALGAAEGIRSRLDLRPWPSVQWVSDMLTQAADGMADPAAQAARLAGAQMDPIEAAQIALRPVRASSADAAVADNGARR
jgi:tetratricopeptide (TPR) repeat protein